MSLHTKKSAVGSLLVILARMCLNCEVRWRLEKQSLPELVPIILDYAQDVEIIFDHCNMRVFEVQWCVCGKVLNCTYLREMTWEEEYDSLMDAFE